MLPKLDVPEASLPSALRGVEPLVVLSSGGAAGGVVSEGMGYGLMVEGFEAAAGSATGLQNGLRLARAWMALAHAPNAEGAWELPVWKYPVRQCSDKPCHGTATDGDEDAALGLIYLAAALGYPPDFVDWAMRTVIAVASVDLGFPDLYRTLPDGSRVFVPKGGSLWGGLTPEEGPHKTEMQPWCYSPSYFAPGHYRLFREFAEQRWKPEFDSYLPLRLDSSQTTRDELVEAFTGAITGGYNLLFRSSCDSGAVANWVGSRAPCEDPTALSCPGVPWAETPYIGRHGNCTASGTTFGAYGADASRAPWRVAMDYVLYTQASTEVPMYDRRGRRDYSVTFNAQVYLNRFVSQYRQNALCNGGEADSCWWNVTNTTRRIAADKLALAFQPTAPDMTCGHVPNAGEEWWAAFMAYPTFTAFVAPHEALEPEESRSWMETFASICVWEETGLPNGTLCASSYFELSQEVISSMITAGALEPLGAVAPNPARPAYKAPAPTPAPTPKTRWSAPSPPPSLLPPMSERVVSPSGGGGRKATAAGGGGASAPFPLSVLPGWLQSVFGFKGGASSTQGGAGQEASPIGDSISGKSQLPPSASRLASAAKWQMLVVLAAMLVAGAVLGPSLLLAGQRLASHVRRRVPESSMAAELRAAAEREAHEPLWGAQGHGPSTRALQRGMHSDDAL